MPFVVVIDCGKNRAGDAGCKVLFLEDFGFAEMAALSGSTDAENTLPEHLLASARRYKAVQSCGTRQPTPQRSNQMLSGRDVLSIA